MVNIYYILLYITKCSFPVCPSISITEVVYIFKCLVYSYTLKEIYGYLPFSKHGLKKGCRFLQVVKPIQFTSQVYQAK